MTRSQLYRFCITDLPATTRAPEINDRNAVGVWKGDKEHWTGVDESEGYGISRENVGRYLRYLTEIGFVASAPEGERTLLPEIEISKAQRQVLGALGRRGGASS